MKSDEALNNILVTNDNPASEFEGSSEEDIFDSEDETGLLDNDPFVQFDWIGGQLCTLLNTCTMDQLYETSFPVRSPIIQNFLMPGTYLLAGSAKTGKSFLVAQIGYCVSTGTDLWGFKVDQGEVLYLALEDDLQRLQRRLYSMFDVNASAAFHLTVDAKKLTEGLDAQLEAFVQMHPNTKLIIIDTLQKIRDAAADKFSYANDYEMISKLKAISNKHNLCILIVHHVRKMSSEDPFNEISGTNGLLGSADGAIKMTRERFSNHATLDITGRDQPESKFSITFDPERFLWELDSVDTELWKTPPDPLLDSICRIVDENNPEWTGTASQLAEHIHSDLSPNVLTRKLNILSGRLFEEYHIRFKKGRSHDGRKIRFQYEKP